MSRGKVVNACNDGMFWTPPYSRFFGDVNRTAVSEEADEIRNEIMQSEIPSTETVPSTVLSTEEEITDKMGQMTLETSVVLELVFTPTLKKYMLAFNTRAKLIICTRCSTGMPLGMIPAHLASCEHDGPRLTKKQAKKKNIAIDIVRRLPHRAPNHSCVAPPLVFHKYVRHDSTGGRAVFVALFEVTPSESWRGSSCMPKEAMGTGMYQSMRDRKLVKDNPINPVTYLATSYSRWPTSGTSSSVDLKSRNENNAADKHVAREFTFPSDQLTGRAREEPGRREPSSKAKYQGLELLKSALMRKCGHATPVLVPISGTRAFGYFFRHAAGIIPLSSLPPPPMSKMFDGKGNRKRDMRRIPTPSTVQLGGKICQTKEGRADAPFLFATRARTPIS
ncbi:hypothetical protein C8R44DRAFT_749859 [Mycena epipterygia]|nr:hypothetical protein C8R44DRAFT_749859 [Mycena epipterygia]